MSQKGANGPEDVKVQYYEGFIGVSHVFEETKIDNPFEIVNDLPNGFNEGIGVRDNDKLQSQITADENSDDRIKARKLLPKCPSILATATIVSFYDYDKKTNKLLNRLSKTSKRFAKSHESILRAGFLKKEPPPSPPVKRINGHFRLS